MTSSTPRLSRLSLLCFAFALLLGGCGKGDAGAAGKTTSGPASAASQARLIVSVEDIVTVKLSERAQGPVITGSIQPERKADLRAEVSAVVLQVLKENGETVRRGDLLVRLDDQSIRDNLSSADEAARASAQSFEQAERQMQRLKTLQAQGMTSVQALEDAEVRRNNAQSDVLAAKARVAAARQQLARTEVRAPFDGVVSERKASVGDTASVGKELVKVIDPRSMRLEGLVSADRLNELKLGQKVNFRVNGYPGSEFTGEVKRVDAAANASTRQVEVLVALTGDAPKVAGLYAEGRITTGSAQVLMLPESALQRAGDSAVVWRATGSILSKVNVQLGERDERTGDVLLKSGLATGDKLLRRPGSNLKDGQGLEWAKAVAQPAALAGAAGAAGPAASVPGAASASK